jgi:hypothetical protein
MSNPFVCFFNNNLYVCGSEKSCWKLNSSWQWTKILALSKAAHFLNPFVCLGSKIYIYDDGFPGSNDNFFDKLKIQISKAIVLLLFKSSYFFSNYQIKWKKAKMISLALECFDMSNESWSRCWPR